MSTNDIEKQAFAILDQFVEGYNGKRIDEICRLFHEDIRLIHHNRGLELSSREQVRCLMRAVAERVPDRRYSQIRRRTVADGLLFVEATWEGTSAVELPTYGRGEALSVLAGVGAGERSTGEGTSAVELPGSGRGTAVPVLSGVRAGERLHLELCTVWTIREGLIVEWHDYG